MSPLNIVVQLSTREKVTEFRAGLDDAQAVIALGLDAPQFRTLAGIDAFYVSLTRAERWGSRPLPPHTAALLHTTEADQKDGMPKYIVTGLVLNESEPNTANFCIPLLVKAVRTVVEEVNAQKPGAIRTVGFFEFELTFPGADFTEIARLLVKSFRR